jgi:hypothetical protein
VTSRLAWLSPWRRRKPPGSRPSENQADPPLAKGSLASYLGTVHETLSRTFARLVKDKVIEVDGRA